MRGRTKVMAVAVAILAMTASCTGVEPAEEPENTGSRRTGSSPSLDRFEVAAEPLWRGDRGGLPEIMAAGWDSAQFLDDALFLQYANDTMAAVDPATGRPRWTVDPELVVGNEPMHATVANSTGYAPVVRVGNEQAMIVDYNSTGADATGWTAALRAKDARPLWKAPRPDRSFLHVMDGDDRLVLLSMGERLGPPTVRAINTADGSTRWERQGVWAQFVAGERVLGTVSSKAPNPMTAADDAYAVGLDARNGQERWSLEDRYQTSELGLVAGDVAVVYTRPGSADDPDAYGIALIDVGSGAEIARLGYDLGRRNSCAADADRLIACTVFEDTASLADSARLVTFDVARRTKHVSPKARASDVAEFTVRKVWHDYVFVRDGGVTYDTVAVDRDGSVVSDTLPGDLIGISDEYAAFSLPRERKIPVVYRLEN